MYYCAVIDSDECWAGTDVNVINKLAGKLLIMLLLIEMHSNPVNTDSRDRTAYSFPLEESFLHTGWGVLWAHCLAFHMNTTEM